MQLSAIYSFLIDQWEPLIVLSPNGSQNGSQKTILKLLENKTYKPGA